MPLASSNGLVIELLRVIKQRHYYGAQGGPTVQTDRNTNAALTRRRYKRVNSLNNPEAQGMLDTPTAGRQKR